jgi:hypothetical protein
MAKRKIESFWTGNVAVTVYRDSEWAEYIVILVVDGVEEDRYHTDSRQDALDTAHKMMMTEWKRQQKLAASEPRTLAAYKQGANTVILQQYASGDLALTHRYSVVRSMQDKVMEIYSCNDLEIALREMTKMTVKLQAILLVSVKEQEDSENE